MNVLFSRDWRGSFCKLTNLKVTERNESMCIESREQEGNSKADVKTLTIAYSKMHFIPVNLSLFLNLTSLHIFCARLKEITKDDIKGFRNLSRLQIDNCDLERLPSDLFVFTRRLTYVTFYRNDIKIIGKHILAPLQIDQLTRLDFMENATIDNCYAREGACSSDCRYVSLERLIEIVGARCQQDNQEPVSPFVADLWSTGLHTDFDFTFNDGRVISVHKNILAIQSSVLAEKFVSKSGKNKCNITGTNYEAFNMFLEYIYMRKIPTRFSHVLEVYAVADRCKVQNLFQICEKIILDNLKKGNATEALRMANIHHNELMKICAFDAIKKFLHRDIPEKMANFPDILQEIMNGESHRKRHVEEAEANMKRMAEDANDEFQTLYDSALCKIELK
jgi:hypothetical protein